MPDIAALVAIASDSADPRSRTCPTLLRSCRRSGRRSKSPRTRRGSPPRPEQPRRTRRGWPPRREPPVDRLAFDFGQDRGRDREAEQNANAKRSCASASGSARREWYPQGRAPRTTTSGTARSSYFDRVIELKGSKVDAALYWKAYLAEPARAARRGAHDHRRAHKNHPNSPYRKQATVLEAEVRRDIGQPVRPQDSADDEVKLMALQALQNTAPEEAVPMLEKVLEGTASRKVKQRALFVLAQSKSPRAREVLRNYAKGSSTPELQSQAIQYLGRARRPEIACGARPRSMARPPTST